MLEASRRLIAHLKPTNRDLCLIGAQCCRRALEPSVGPTMARHARNSKGSRLGTKFRGKLAAAYGHRGVGQNSLWYVYSPRTRSDWVLRSDVEWDHFVLAEADP